MTGSRTIKSKKKRRRLFLFSMMILAAASVAASLGLIYIILEKSSNPLLTKQPDVELPSFVGMTEAQVKAVDGFNYEIEYMHNSEYDEGVVFAQKPTAPRSVKANSTVKLKVSKGALTAEMPDIVKAPRAKAEMELAKYDVDIYIKMEESTTMPEGLVIRTQPAVGEPIKSGDVVTIYIAADEVDSNRIVPGVVGMNIEDAKKKLTQSGLSTRMVLTANDQPAGTVIWQSLGEGAQVRVGTVVELHVSAGQ